MFDVQYNRHTFNPHLRKSWQHAHRADTLEGARLPKDGPVAVEDLVKYFPNKHVQAIEKLWGSHRLTYKGKQFFSEEGNDLGPVYKGAIEEGERAAKEENVNYMQEVYLGYQPKTGHLWIGFDAWTDDHDLDVWGVLIELVSNDGEDFEAKQVIAEPGGFYRGIHNYKAHGNHAFKHLALTDLRLD